MVERFQRPAGKKCTKLGFVGKVPQFLALARQKSKSLAVGAAVDDAGIGVRSADLFPAARDGICAGSVELVFPPHDNRIGEEDSQARQDFFRWAQNNVKLGDGAANFSRSVGSLDPVHHEITQRSCVKDGHRLSWELFQDGHQRGVRGEGDNSCMFGRGMSGHFPAQAEDFETGGRQGF